MTDDTIHTCSYSCERPGCIRAQRDELVARLEALTAAQQQPAAGEEIMVKTPNDVLFILPLQPSGRSIGPRFVVHVPLIEAPAVKALQAEIEALRAEVERLRADRDSWEQQAADRLADWHAEHLRAERLAEALREVMLWIENWSPPFTEDDEWPDTEAKAQAALHPTAAQENDDA